MKKMFNINLILVIVTLALYITLYFGMLFSIVLGFAQVIMSLFILYHFQKLCKVTKALFALYLIPTLIILYGIVMGTYLDMDNTIKIIVAPMALALLHLYITYRLKTEY